MTLKIPAFKPGCHYAELPGIISMQRQIVISYIYETIYLSLC